MRPTMVVMGLEDLSDQMADSDDVVGAPEINAFMMDLGKVSSGEIVTLAGIEGIAEFMRCSFCQRVSAPPRVATCVVGHLICALCVVNLPPGLCPKQIDLNNDPSKVCGKQIGRFKSQLYEYIYNNSTFNCFYADFGCPVTSLGSNLKAHGRICNHRLSMGCPFTECSEGRLSRVSYIPHLTTAHNVVLVDSASHRLQVSISPNCTEEKLVLQKYRRVCGLFNCYDLTFMLLAEEQHQNLYIWMSLVSEAKVVKGREFHYTITLSDESFKQRIVWKENVYPFGKSFEKIVSEGESLLIAKSAFYKKFVYKSEDQFFWNANVQVEEILSEKKITPVPTLRIAKAPKQTEDLPISEFSSNAEPPEKFAIPIAKPRKSLC